MSEEELKFDCEKCALWQKAAKESGYANGMCKDCFDKYYVPFVATYIPETKSTSDNY